MKYIYKRIYILYVNIQYIYKYIYIYFIHIFIYNK